MENQEHWGPNGPKLTGIEFFRGKWISKGGASIVGVRVEQGALVGEVLSPGGQRALLKGDAWRDVQIRGHMSCPADGTLKLNVQARIRDVVPEGGGAGPSGDARRYKLEVLWPPVGSSPQSWTDEFTPGYAVALDGVWDDRTGEHRSRDDMLTLAGDDTAVGKCYQTWRYRPLDASEPARSKPMSDLHAACVRMVRADYCGDGKSATQTGTHIDVWDTANVNTKEPDMPGHGFEAAWTSKGAVCLDHRRLPTEKECFPALPICHSPEVAKALAKQKGLGDALLFNASCKSLPCADPHTPR
ncbi:ADYC domain-containing protein [Sorangium sp. So ce1000]|uniref:ADYC domain-containing protein n=1 Tax=Sorangium sp. So ce1000 TaxID=3133325 RepID=UPI003F642284